VRCVASEVPKWQGYFAALLRTREAPKEEAWDEYQSAVYSPQDVLRVSDSLSIVRRAYADATVGQGEGVQAPAVPPLEEQATIGFCEVS
jgi:hypothetical protein